MVLNKLDKDIIESFVATLARTCTRIKEAIKFIPNMIKQSLKQKVDYENDVEYLKFLKAMELYDQLDAWNEDLNTKK